MPKCFNCGADLDYEDVLDTELDGDIMTNKCVGSCPKCGKSYIWVDVYKYTHTQEMEETESETEEVWD